jgi:RND superfamily putative drug exporter
MAALLLDATVVRMFLVPSVMKLLGDDCWWAPRWARRLQNRIGLGEIDLPDEHKRPSLDGRALRPPVTASSVVAQPQRALHDPTHPGVPEPPRPARPGPAGRPAQEQPAPTAKQLPSGAATARMQARSRQPTEANTTRLAAPSAPTSGQSTPAGTTASGSTRPTPSTDQTRGIPVSSNRSEHSGDTNGDPADPTAALPVMRSDADDSDAATEKLNARGQGDKARQRRRVGGGLSAQDLLRREGRL